MSKEKKQSLKYAIKIQDKINDDWIKQNGILDIKFIKYHFYIDINKKDYLSAFIKFISLKKDKQFMLSFNKSKELSKLTKLFNTMDKKITEKLEGNKAYKRALEREGK